METFLKVGGLSVKAQSNHSVSTATDQRGEQTINKDAKNICNILYSHNLPVAVCNKAVESSANLPERRRTILAFLKGIKSARIKEWGIKKCGTYYCECHKKLH